MNKCIQILSVFFLIGFVTCDVSEIVHNEVDDTCVNCLCLATTGCDPTVQCAGDVCGMYRITWPYWADAGKFTLPGESPTSQTAYANCANDKNCAERTIQGYMSKFRQDCNQDGVIDCLDYAAIHKLGGYGCKGYIPEDYKTKIEQCAIPQLDVRVDI